MKESIAEKGFSLVMVIVFIALLSSLAIISLRMSGLTASSMYGEKNGKQAYYIAEAAYQDALFRLNQNTAWRGNLSSQPFAGGSYSLDVSQTSPIDNLTITAVGSFGGTDRTIVRVIPPPVKAFIIVAYAGTGVSGSTGDGSLSINATFNKPIGLANNGAGDLYIVDSSSHRVREVNKMTRIVTKVVGTSSGYNPPGDGGLAVNAKLNTPQGVAVTQTGDVYIADTNNCRIRKVTAATGIITTYAGTGTCGYNPPGDGGLATSARLNNPRDVIVDAVGNLYIADASNCRIRKVDAVTKNISTFAGTGTCNLSGDGGLATAARINSPRGLAFDTTGGNLYFADRSNNRIRKINMVTKIIATVAGTSGGFAGDGGPAINAKLNQPNGVSINQFGSIYIADTGNNRIRKVDPTGTITTFAGSSGGNNGDGDVATAAQLNQPNRVIAYDDVDGHLMISDTNNNRVREVTNVY